MHPLLRRCALLMLSSVLLNIGGGSLVFVASQCGNVALDKAIALAMWTLYLPFSCLNLVALIVTAVRIHRTGVSGNGDTDPGK